VSAWGDTSFGGTKDWLTTKRAQTASSTYPRSLNKSLQFLGLGCYEKGDDQEIIRCAFLAAQNFLDPGRVGIAVGCLGDSGLFRSYHYCQQI
jgi:hypothetical protein